VAAAVTERRVRLAFADDTVEVRLVEGPEGAAARCAGREIAVSAVPLGGGVYAVAAAGRRTTVHYVVDGETAHLQLDGHVYVFRLSDASTAPHAASSVHHQDLRAPMPGVVTRIFIDAGQTVAPGDPLFAVEAMKLEHVVRAPAAGRVARIHGRPGVQVEAGAVVVEVEES
jgi:3-methylcrotonyl-CoA carboxylase alpha subunit